MKLCICHSGKPFNKCCDRFLSQGKLAKTPEQLMRSRYSAYALGGFGEYLYVTWHPKHRSGLTALNLSQVDTAWCGLDVLDKTQNGNRAEVEFKAYFLDDNEQRGCLHERSRFERLNGAWLYVDGDIYS